MSFTRYLTLFSQNGAVRHSIILLVIYLPVAIFITISTQGKPGIPYWGDKAEHYNAYLQGYNLLHYDFLKSYGLVDDSTGKEPTDHPFAYIHGAALFPRLYTFSLLALGIEDIYYHSLIFVILSAIWIPLAYLSLKRLFNVHIAFWGTLLIATDYQGILTNSFNLFRGWPMVIFFYMLWASVRLDFNKRRVGQYIHLAMAIFIAVSYEFPFAGLCLLIAAYIIYCNNRSFTKTIAVLSIPTLLTLILFVIQVTLYLGGISEVISYGITSFGYRSGQIALTQDIENFYASRRIVFWQYANEPVDTVTNFVPNLARWFVNKNGVILGIFVLISNLFVFGWYLYYGLKRKELSSETNFNLAYFLAFAAVSMLILTVMFPAYMVLVNQLWLPMTVFFIYLSVPMFGEWLHRQLGLSSPLIIGVFLVFWGGAQLYNFYQRPPTPDPLLEKLQADYAGNSFGTPIDFQLYSYQPLWYAVRSDVAFVEVNPSSSNNLPCHLKNLICYSSLSSYYSDREKLPDYLLVGELGIEPIKIKHLLAISGITSEFRGYNFWILKINDVEMLEDQSDNTALYFPTEMGLSSKVKAGMLAISGSGEEILLEPGDLVWAGNQLVRMEANQVTHLIGYDGQAVVVENLGVWDQQHQARSGQRLVYQNGSWKTDPSEPVPTNLNFDFSRGNESDPIPEWWIRANNADYEISRMQDETGPFVRIRAAQDTPQLIIGQSPPTDIGNASVSLLAQIRTNSKQGHQVLGMVDNTQGATQEYKTETTINNQWNILGIPWTQVQISSDDSYAVGLFNVKAGDWFDVRELSVYIGPPSQ